MVTMELICLFVCANAKKRFSHDAANIYDYRNSKQCIPMIRLLFEEQFRCALRISMIMVCTFARTRLSKNIGSTILSLSGLTVDSEMFARIFANLLPCEFKVLANIENT